MTITILILGSLFHFAFHALTPEETIPNRTYYEPILTIEKSQEVQTFDDFSTSVSMKWRDWLLEPQFYKVSNISRIDYFLTSEKIKELFF